MDELHRAAAILGCQQAVHRFFAALDASDYDAVAAGMAPDGVWYRQGKELKGPDQVRTALADRPRGRVTAHMVQNLVVELEDQNTASVRYFSLVYRHDGDGSAPGPAPLGQPLSIASNTDRMRRDGDRWLVVERRSRRVFGA